MSIIDEIPEITEDENSDFVEDEIPTTEDLDAMYQAWDDVADWGDIRNLGFKIG